MQIHASAPGKLVLLGEYAVLEGAPALVMAVDRRARAMLTRIEGDTCEIVSPTLHRVARCTLRADHVRWVDHAPPDELAWLDVLLRAGLVDTPLPAFRVELDTGGFYLDQHDAKAKLGLGSSAALLVAFAGALCALGQRPAPSLSELVALHREIQGGHGSGIDVAASLHGGLSSYRLDGDKPWRVPLRMPRNLYWCCVFTGESASTATMLRMIAAWRARETGDYESHVRELAGIAGNGIDAITRDDAQAFLDSLNSYGQALARFGGAGDVDIVSAAHRRLGTIAASCGTAYKSCGAGGGDAGITFDVDDKRVRAFRRQALEAGFAVLDVHEDPRGLEVGFAV